MWNLTAYDVNRIRGQLQARRARIDTKYAEETKALDADFADVETLERVAAALALKYKSEESADLSQESPENVDDGVPRVEDVAASEPHLATASGDGSSPDAKLGSRWRLALRDRPVVSEAE
jgi:hypothetical protein